MDRNLTGDRLKTFTADELLALPDMDSPEEGKKVFTTTELLSLPSDEQDENILSPEEKTARIQAIRDDMKTPFITRMGDTIYNGLVNSGLKIGAGVQSGASGFNKFLGDVTMLSSNEWYRKNMIEPGQYYRQQSKELFSEVDPLSAEGIYYSFLEGAGHLMATLPMDVMTGAATKAMLVGRVIPAVGGVLARIPGFALGMGWRGMVEAIDGTHGGVVEKTMAGAIGAAESVAIGTLYGSAGTGLKGIGKMAAFGMASAFYDAAKQERLPTKEEVIDAGTQGALMGFVFTALPHLVEASQKGAERRAIKEHVKKLEVQNDPHKVLTDFAADKRIRPEIRQSLIQPFLDELTNRGPIAPMEFNLGQWKDRTKIGMFVNTMERNIEKVAGKSAEAVKKDTTQMVKLNERYKQEWLNNMKAFNSGKEVFGRGLRPGNKASKLTMRFGEGNMSLEELQKARPKDWQNIEAAAKTYRRMYKTILDDLNGIRAKYDYDPIPERADYFRHFQELSVGQMLSGHFFGTPLTSNAGVSKFIRSGKPFTATEMRRYGLEFKEDAVLAFQNYYQAVSDQIFHLDSVQRVRTLENHIRKQAAVNEMAQDQGEAFTKIDLDNFVSSVTRYGNFLAGQPSKFTQAINEWFDRPILAGIKALQRNVSANIIGFNVSSSFMNLLPTAQELASLRPDFVAKGALSSFLHLSSKHPFEIEGQRFRFYDVRFPKDYLTDGIAEKFVQTGFRLPRFFDRMQTQSLLAGKYFELRNQGFDKAQASEQASDFASRLVQSRAKGELPELFTEPDLRLVTMFQVEVTNLFNWLAHDVPREAQGNLAKTVGRMALYALAANFFNGVYEKTMGRRPLFDPFYVLATLGGLTKSGKNRPFVERLSPVVKDVGGNIPFGNLFIEGGRFPVTDAFPDFKKLRTNPEQFFKQEMVKPLSLVVPFGGINQFRKTYEGTTAWARGAVFTPSGNVRYEVEKNFLNFVRGFLFGKNAFPEAVEYWAEPESERR